MGRQLMVLSEVTADNSAMKASAQEETNVLGEAPIPKIKTRGPEPEALPNVMAKARATTKEKGTQ